MVEWRSEFAFWKQWREVFGLFSLLFLHPDAIWPLSCEWWHEYITVKNVTNTFEYNYGKHVEFDVRAGNFFRFYV